MLDVYSRGLVVGRCFKPQLLWRITQKNVLGTFRRNLGLQTAGELRGLALQVGAGCGPAASAAWTSRCRGTSVEDTEVVPEEGGQQLGQPVKAPQGQCPRPEGCRGTGAQSERSWASVPLVGVNGSNIRGVCLTLKELGQTETRIMSWKVFPLLIARLNPID